jgi:transcriptional regulator with XRE-family HTH domain
MLTGIELRRLRQNANLQQQEVAAASGVERWRLSQIERGPLQGKPLSGQEERTIRTAIARLGALERKRKAIIARVTRPQRARHSNIPSGLDRPDGEAQTGPPEEEMPAEEETADPIVVR